MPNNRLKVGDLMYLGQWAIVTNIRVSHGIRKNDMLFDLPWERVYIVTCMHDGGTTDMHLRMTLSDKGVIWQGPRYLGKRMWCANGWDVCV